MKKQAAALIAAALLLAGCQPAAPVSAPVAPGALSSVEGASDAQTSSIPEQAPQETPSDNTSQSPRLPVSVPQPDTPPQTTAGAITLPESIAETAADGYTAEVLTPAQYDLNFPLNRGGFRGFQTCEFFFLEQDGKIAVANANGKLLTEPLYTSTLEGWFTFHGVIPLTLDGKTGAIDMSDGTQLAPFEYDDVRAAGGDGGGLLEVQKGDQYEILDREGNSHYSLERGDSFYVLGKRHILLKDGMLRIYSKEYQPVQNFAVDDMQVVSRSSSPRQSGRDLLAVQMSGAWALCDTDGKMLTNPVYESIGFFFGDYAPVVKNGKYGVVNYKGVEVIKPEWEELYLYDGSVSVCKNGRWGAITDIDSGRLAIDPVYDYIAGFGDYGYACFEKSGRYGVIDRNGNEIVPARYDGEVLIDGANLDKGYFLINGGNGPYSNSIVEGDGRVIIPSDHFIVPGQDGEKYNLVLTPSGKWGYADDRGRLMIDAQYDNADAFIKGKNVAFVQKDGKICMIDRKGNMVLRTVFSDLIGYNPDTMVCAMEYTDASGAVKGCLVKIGLPEKS
ncbi:WG repeat-containing protein [Anaerotruncus colihominis]|uniref:KWG Leptospira n=1 Tax=Anaerotruncus colihominis TaxID=169435 RepID=A0A845RF03_9FIRM|nr:WG repeat-containing protein [Anaerotruncus colihominis]NBI78686.1 hypothetical protein [Anaerotruncus colihominis]